MSASRADKFGKLQQMLVDAPEYFLIADSKRAGCKSFLGLVGADSPDADEIEVAYDAALCEVRNLVAKGLLTGIEQADLEPGKPEGTAEDGTSDEDVPVTGVVESPEAPLATSAAEGFPEREFHAAAAIFPMMSDADLSALAQDIRTNGLRDDIIIAEGKIADGRNRYSACRQAGVIPRFTEWDGEGSLVSWVLSVNLHRRHLTDQQRAVVAARAKEAFEAEAEMRRIANLSRNRGSVESANRRSREPSNTETGKSAAKAAEDQHVSTRAVERASRVIKQGDNSLVEAVNQGTVSLDAAAAVSRLPHDEQRKLVASGKVKDAAAKMRRQKTPESKPAARPEPTPTPEPAPSSSPTTESKPFGPIVMTLPEAQREPAKSLVKETVMLVMKIASASADDADLALRGLRALVARTRGFLQGDDDGGFLREALEASPATK